MEQSGITLLLALDTLGRRRHVTRFLSRNKHSFQYNDLMNGRLDGGIQTPEAVRDRQEV